MNTNTFTVQKFWSRVAKSGCCWLWTAAKCGSGYGKIRRGGRHQDMAHRVSWELAHGPIPQGMWVLHRCDVRACVRPDHLFLGTNADNVRDMHAKGRARSGGNDNRGQPTTQKAKRVAS